MDKSYVTVEQHKCKICTNDYDTNALLLDRRLKPVFDRHTVTGWGVCPDCEARLKEGYLAMILIDPLKSEIVNGLVKPEGAWRTGEIIFLKKEAAERMFNPCPGQISFIDKQIVGKLRKHIQ